jgi:large subunit ribosomal protein L10e
MGRRLSRFYRYQKSNPFSKSRYNRCVPDSKPRIYDIGRKNAFYNEFPHYVHLVFGERSRSPLRHLRPPA